MKEHTSSEYLRLVTSAFSKEINHAVDDGRSDIKITFELAGVIVARLNEIAEELEQ